VVLDLLMSLDKGLLGCGLLCFLCSCSFMNGLVVVGWKVEGGRWKVEGGRWKVEGGRWKVEGGRWTVEGGRWKVEGGRWKVEGSVVLGLRFIMALFLFLI